MNINQQAINETMAQFDRQCVHVYFCKESGSFKMLNSADNHDAFAKSIGYDSIEELLHDMNQTYNALCIKEEYNLKEANYAIVITLSTSTEVSLYLAKIGMKNSRVYRDGVEISPNEFETENE